MHELTSRPPVGDDTFVLGTPAWLSAALRLATAAMAAALAGLSAGEWSGMPVAARLLVLVLVPTLLGWALWPRPRRRMTQLVADREGLYLPHRSQLLREVGQAEDPRWLFVPWSRVSGLRLSRASGGERCVAFDVELAGSARHDAYFASVESPQDRPASSPGSLHAAFAHWPPPPRRTLQRLQALQHRSRS